MGRNSLRKGLLIFCFKAPPAAVPSKPMPFLAVLGAVKSAFGGLMGAQRKLLTEPADVLGAVLPQDGPPEIRFRARNGEEVMS